MSAYEIAHASLQHLNALPLRDIDAFDVDDFKAWFRQRFEALYDEDQRARYRAFDLRHLGIPFGESYLDVIQNLAGKLQKPARDNLVAALCFIETEAHKGVFLGNIHKDKAVEEDARTILWIIEPKTQIHYPFPSQH